MAYEEVLFPVCFTGKKKNCKAREAQNKKWDFNDFIVIGTWKPKKKNLCNNHFMERMREKNERIPDPGERFSYFIVKGPHLRNEKGWLIPYRVGDYMEYTGTTVGICARFINEDDRYQPPPSHKIMQLKYSDEKEKQTRDAIRMKFYNP
ncbi:hypothetical protein C1646_761934 [Rhizophagus diaphanus]|nr:hypothetical protein C1646_761934 [Rhizophagus diaphanus] [Rhizophagus sp. MUCL 43196]